MTKEYIPNCRTREIDATVKEVLDCREGVVMDSYIAVDNNDELFVVIDTYETAWTSGYTLYRGNEDKLWTIWEQFADKYDEMFGEEE